MSPMQRTLAWLREHGYEAARTEHWNHFAKRRQDLFGFIDVLAVSDHHLLAIQVSDDTHHAAHRKKILANKAARLLVYHMDIEIWSWGLRLTRERRKDKLLDRRKEQTLRRDALTATLLPKKSLLRKKIESGEWPMHTLD
jgi:hypothetical protein